MERQMYGNNSTETIITPGGFSSGISYEDKRICGEKEFIGSPVGNYDSSQELYGNLFKPMGEKFEGIANIVYQADPDFSLDLETDKPSKSLFERIISYIRSSWETI